MKIRGQSFNCWLPPFSSTESCLQGLDSRGLCGQLSLLIPEVIMLFIVTLKDRLELITRRVTELAKEITHFPQHREMGTDFMAPQSEYQTFGLSKSQVHAFPKSLFLAISKEEIVLVRKIEHIPSHFNFTCTTTLKGRLGIIRKEIVVWDY